MGQAVPYVTGLCSQQVKLDTYIGYLNQALNLMLDTVNEALDEDFQLPGIPSIQLPQSRDIYLWGWNDWERPLRLRHAPDIRGYSGNVFPLRNQNKKTRGSLTLPGAPDLIVGAPPAPTVPGVDPSKEIIRFLNQNITLLFDFINESGFELDPILVPFMEICEEPNGLPETEGGQGASPGQIIIDQILGILTGRIEEGVAGGGETCSIQPITDGIFPSFGGQIGCWNLTDVSVLDVPPLVTTNAAGQSFRILYAANSDPAFVEVWSPYAIPDCSACTVTSGSVDASCVMELAQNELGDPFNRTFLHLLVQQQLSNGNWGTLAIDQQIFFSPTTGTFNFSCTGATVATPGTVASGMILWADKLRFAVQVSPDEPIGPGDVEVIVSNIVFTYTP